MWIPALLLAGCVGSEEPPEVIVVDTPGAVAFQAEVWADNWFAFYLGERLIVEDSTPITTERSFNAEAFVFNADYPLQLNFVARDFKQDDTGLEYIGRSNQQMGDGGLIAQFTDVATGAAIAVTDAAWRCLRDRTTRLSTGPARTSPSRSPGVGPCRFEATPEPDGWRRPEFDDAEWPSAVEHSEADVRPRGGYDAIEWRNGATVDLERRPRDAQHAAVPPHRGAALTAPGSALQNRYFRLRLRPQNRLSSVVI